MIAWLDSMAKAAGLGGLAVLFFASGLEYLFPPFPGDSATVLGGVYAIRGGISAAIVFAVLMAGSMLGAMGDWAIGRWLGRKLASAPPKGRVLKLLSREQILQWEERFRRRGALWLAFNRFMPGVRGPIFMAAGASGLSAGRVLLWGGLSSLAWNALLFGAGCALGGEIEAIERLMCSYGRLFWIALAAVGAGMMVKLAIRRASRSRTSRAPVVR
jgi:membrane-associated protein